MTHACYLLRSLNPRYRSRFYIGCTVNPQRRFRQHNGELAQGASFTKEKRPWEMVLCVFGFPSHVAALKFEWAWQHPLKSIAVREAAGKLESLKGVTAMVKLVFTMLTLPEWQRLNITVQFLCTSHAQHRKGCPHLPEQMQVLVAPLYTLPGKDSGDDESSAQEDAENSLQSTLEDDELSEKASIYAAESTFGDIVRAIPFDSSLIIPSDTDSGKVLDHLDCADVALHLKASEPAKTVDCIPSKGEVTVGLDLVQDSGSGIEATTRKQETKGPANKFYIWTGETNERSSSEFNIACGENKRSKESEITSFFKSKKREGKFGLKEHPNSTHFPGNLKKIENNHIVQSESAGLKGRSLPEVIVLDDDTDEKSHSELGLGVPSLLNELGEPKGRETVVGPRLRHESRKTVDELVGDDDDDVQEISYLTFHSTRQKLLHIGGKENELGY